MNKKVWYSLSRMVADANKIKGVHKKDVLRLDGSSPRAMPETMLQARIARFTSACRRWKRPPLQGRAWPDGSTPTTMREALLLAGV